MNNWFQDVIVVSRIILDLPTHFIIPYVKMLVVVP